MTSTIIAIEYVNEEGDFATTYIDGVDVHTDIPDRTTAPDLDIYTVQFSQLTNVIESADKTRFECHKLGSLTDEKKEELGFEIVEDILKDPAGSYKFLVKTFAEGITIGSDTPDTIQD
jgi:hypothetical protein